MTTNWTANTVAYEDRTSKEGATMSYEVFPPANDLAARQLDATVKSLAALAPEFVSVTCGAGGEGSRNTLSTVLRLKRETPVPVSAHVVAGGRRQSDIEDEITTYLRHGIKDIVALRGDAVSSPEEKGGVTSAEELVRGIKPLGPRNIAVAGYPEGHPEAISEEAEIRYLKRKVDAGANRIITQFFFDTEVFVRFIERVRNAGIDVPVFPGILPILNFDGAVRFAEKCGTRIPDWYHVMYRDLKQDQLLHKAISASIAVEQCRQLLAFGIGHFHFYSLNQAELVNEICNQIGIHSKTSYAPLRQTG